MSEASGSTFLEFLLCGVERWDSENEEEKEVKGVKWCYSMKGHEISSWILEHNMSNEVTDKSETDHLESRKVLSIIFSQCSNLVKNE